MRTQRRRSGISPRVDSTVLIYENDSELTAFAVPFVKRGLAAGGYCAYMCESSDREGITDALNGQGVNVAREVSRGALELLTWEDHYGPGHFEPLRSVELLRGRAEKAVADGSTTLHMAVEMAWAVRAGVSADALALWESLIEEISVPVPTTVAWMFRRAQFESAFLRYIIRSHARVIAGDHVDLSLSALFRSLAPASVKRWLRSAKERRVPRGGFYFRQDDPAMDLYLLTKGTVKLVRTERDGRSAILRLVLPAEPFGYVDALGATSRIASAQAAEESRALCWDVPTMLRELMTNPTVSLSTIRVLAEDVRRSVDRAQELAMSPVDRRLARLLLRLAESVGRKTSRGIVIRLALSGEELGEMIAVTPYTVSRVLAEWRRLDIVDAQPGRILIFNPERLRAVADKHQAKPARTQGTRPNKLNR